jgi:hypothetical protein
VEDQFWVANQEENILHEYGNQTPEEKEIEPQTTKEWDGNQEENELQEN